MKIVKHYWFVAIALITMISFSSCESDEERGFDISGLYGKTAHPINQGENSLIL